jgi:hypothetical protein
LNPIIDSHASFDVTDDYPRSDVENYQQAVEAKERNHAVVVEGTFALDDEEKKQVAEVYGTKALASDEIILSRGYDRTEHACTLFVGVRVDEAAVVKHLVDTFGVPEQQKAPRPSKHPSRRLGRASARVDRVRLEMARGRSTRIAWRDLPLA